MSNTSHNYAYNQMGFTFKRAVDQSISKNILQRGDNLQYPMTYILNQSEAMITRCIWSHIPLLWFISSDICRVPNAFPESNSMIFP